MYAIFVQILINITQFSVIERFHFGKGKGRFVALWWEHKGKEPHLAIGLLPVP